MELDRSHAEEVQQQYHQAVFNVLPRLGTTKNRSTWKKTLEKMGKLKLLDKKGEQSSRSYGMAGYCRRPAL